MAVPTTPDQITSPAWAGAADRQQTPRKDMRTQMLIDATLPPPNDPRARDQFERIRPLNPELRLAEFAAAGSQALVDALPTRFFGSKLLD